jgi:parallel beta-helix repeat protein
MRRAVCVLSVVVLILGVTPTANAETSGTLVITSNTTLTEDHHGSIVIEADGVTLDCAGFRVVGPSSDPSIQDGIVVALRTGVTIRNCTVEGFPRGIILATSSGTTVVHNRLIGNGDNGLYLSNSDGSVITENVATGNSGSGYGGDFGWSTFEHNIATANGGHGFDMTRSSHNTFRRNVVTDNGGHGFKIFDDTDWNIFDRNRVSRNGMTGFLMYGGFDANQNYQLAPPDHNTFSRNEVIANGEGGLYLVDEAAENLVQGNLVLLNREFGIALLRVTDNQVRLNVACRNEIWDALQEGGSGNSWQQNAFCRTSGI